MLLIVFLVSAFILLKPQSVYADTYWPDGDSDGVPNQFESDFSTACGTSAHTYHTMWFDPYELTPATGDAWDSTYIRSTAHPCPGVTYTNITSITHTITAAHPAISFPSGTVIYPGNTSKGNTASPGALAVNINVGALGPGCHVLNFTFNVSARHDGTLDTDNGNSLNATLCITAPVVDVCPNLPGNQTSIPSGYIKDSAGNCVSPTNNHSPVLTIDPVVCDNFIISGIAYDGDSPNGSVDVHMHIDNDYPNGSPGSPITTQTYPNGHSAKTPANTDRFGVDVSGHMVGVQARSFYVYTLGKDSVGNRASQAGPTLVVLRRCPVDQPPTMSPVVATCSRITGTASDPDGSVTVRLYKGSTFVAQDTDGSFDFDISSHAELGAPTFRIELTGSVPSEAKATSSLNVQNQYRTPGPCRTVRCTSVNISPFTVEPGDSFEVEAKFEVVDGTNTPNPIGANGSSANYRYRMGATPGKPIASNSWQTGILSAGGQFPTTFSYPPPSDPVWTRPSTGTLDAAAVLEVTSPTLAPVSCNHAVAAEVVEKPYFVATNGDVSTGLSQDCSGTKGWTTANAGTLKAWNQLESATGDYTKGAGTNLAAYARSTIHGFASAQGTDVTRRPKRLTFANGGVDFGGGFTAQTNCPKNYYAGASSSGVGFCLYCYTDDQSFNLTSTAASPISFGNTHVFNGGRLAVYVKGDLHITGNTIYKHTELNPNAGWANIKDIPSLYVVVLGNIYISPNTTRLDGVYIAQPDSARPTATDPTGRIYTCSSGTSPPLAKPTPAQLADAASGGCRANQLQVNGAFIAKELMLYRSRGTVRDGPAAEIFNYTPATWLVAPRAINGPATNKAYDAITNLPPVL